MVRHANLYDRKLTITISEAQQRQLRDAVRRDGRKQSEFLRSLIGNAVRPKTPA